MASDNDVGHKDKTKKIQELPRERKKKALDEENNAKEYDEERRRRASYINTHARQRLAKRLRAHVNHGSLKHDPDRARVSKNLNEKERRYLLLILLRRDKDPRDDYYGEEERRIFIKGIFKF